MFKNFGLCFTLLLWQSVVFAIPSEDRQQQIDQKQQVQQQEQARLLRQQQETRPTVRLPRVAPNAKSITENGSLMDYPAQETPCFTLQQIMLVDKDGKTEVDDTQLFSFALADVFDGRHQAIGRCLGIQGINTLMTLVQNRIIERGYITTRVLVAPQDIKSGTLKLTVLPGRIHAIRFNPTEGHYGVLWNTLPMDVGDILNLRDIEQALENFKRIPTVEVDIQIEPAENKATTIESATDRLSAAKPGDSDLVIHYQQTRLFRLSLNTDDAGYKTTGKYQGGVTLSIDSPFKQNDLAYVHYSHSLEGNKRGTEGITGYYSIPWHYWLFSTMISDNRYHQSVAGAIQTYVYSGTSQNIDINLHRLVYRDASIKAGFSVGGFSKASKNFIDDTEIQVQRRQTTGLQFGMDYRQALGKADLEANLSYQHGLNALGTRTSPEQAFGEGTSRFRLLNANASFNFPFTFDAPWGAQTIRYNSQFRAQWNATPLTPQYRFSMGNRYTVRGFDGQYILIADRGWLIRNDFSLPLANSGQALYWGVDYGEVGGQSVKNLVGTTLAGTVLGLRGGYQGLQYDIFVGTPLYKPIGYPTSSVTTGFTVNWTY